MMDDRRVHARCKDYWEVVRYDRAGKWYVEGYGPRQGQRKQVSIWTAVHVAQANAVQVFYRVPGGGSFDAKLRALVAATDSPQPAAARPDRSASAPTDVTD